MMTAAGWLRIARLALAPDPAPTVDDLQDRRDEITICITMLEQEKVHISERIRAARREDARSRLQRRSPEFF